MKRLVILGLLMALFAPSQGRAHQNEKLYITHGGCRAYDGSRDLDKEKPGVQNIEIWLYLNRHRGDYDPDRDIRAYVYLNDNCIARQICEDLYQAHVNLDQQTFHLESHFYENWDSMIVRAFWKQERVECRRFGWLCCAHQIQIGWAQSEHHSTWHEVSSAKRYENDCRAECCGGHLTDNFSKRELGR
jgi:hypothetical protein